MTTNKEAKVALVTGGSSSGIGEATVKRFASKDYRVVVLGTSRERVNRVANECQQLSPSRFQPLRLVQNFSNPQCGKLVVEKTVEHFGQLDVLVNNAGILLSTPTDQPGSFERYCRIMTINVDSTVQASLAAAKYLKETRGCMVFVSSVCSVKPTSQASYAYSMSKASMSMFAKCLAVDLAPHVRVNIVSPGLVRTPIVELIGLSMAQLADHIKNSTLLQRIGEPEEIASAITFLALDEASFITGHEMFVDGGYLLKHQGI